MSAPLRLCPLGALSDPGAKGFTFGDGAMRRDVVVVRQGTQVFAYENACPHQGTPLEFLPDQFLTHDRKHLLCSTHGAIFEIATGYCVRGPCKGKSLRAIPSRVEDGLVVIDSESVPG
jgi:nitrite reductase/ring-hydroxylating ferredoxin subunit